MSYVQLINPNPWIWCRPGWCLEYVRSAFGTPAIYPSATAAWENSPRQHPDGEFPENCAVPVHYALDNEPAGHIVIRMADGSVYSTSDLSNTPHHHQSLENLEAYYAYYGMPLRYRGWTEDVQGIPVVGNTEIHTEAAAVAPVPEAPKKEEDEKMLIIATAPDADNKVWVGDGITRRHIKNPFILDGMQWLSRNGVGPKYFMDGAVQDIPAGIDTIGVDIVGETGGSESVIAQLEGGNEIWVGDGITRSHVPDPDALENLRQLGREGKLNLFRDGEVQTIRNLNALGTAK